MSERSLPDNLQPASRCTVTQHDPRLGMSSPIYTSTAFHYLDEGPQPYPRYFNTPNHNAVAQKIAALESAEAAIVFSSGMAAISTSMMALLRPSDHVLCMGGLYGGTHAFVTEELTRWGVQHDFVEPNVAAFKAKLRSETSLIYVESPNNPLMHVIDLSALSTFARAAGVTTMIDNTFATPINQRPIEQGIDVVIHSGTKYLGGHSDLSAGVVAGPSELVDRIMVQSRRYGGNLNAGDLYQLERSIATLDVRVQRQNENALAIARFLGDDPRVSRVLYPGLDDHPGHRVAKAQMEGFGGMLSFELAESVSVRAFLHALRLITPAMSLGGVESTVTVPAYTSHLAMPEAERLSLGITEGLIRFSAGLEAHEDLVADIQQAITTSEASQ